MVLCNELKLFIYCCIIRRTGQQRPLRQKRFFTQLCLVKSQSVHRQLGLIILLKSLCNMFSEIQRQLNNYKIDVQLMEIYWKNFQIISLKNKENQDAPFCVVYTTTCSRKLILNRRNIKKSSRNFKTAMNLVIDLDLLL